MSHKHGIGHDLLCLLISWEGGLVLFVGLFIACTTHTIHLGSYGSKPVHRALSPCEPPTQRDWYKCLVDSQK